jgi:hypothetical protein
MHTTQDSQTDISTTTKIKKRKGERKDKEKDKRSLLIRDRW